jgi:hypothetical protein
MILLKIVNHARRRYDNDHLNRKGLACVKTNQAQY